MNTLGLGALEWTLIHFVWEGAAVALVLAALLFVVSSARTRYALACGALLAMLAAFALTLARLWPGSPGNFAAEGGLWRGFQNAAGAFPPMAVAAGNRLRWLGPVWMIGVCLFTLRSAVGWLAVLKLRHQGLSPVPQDWHRKLAAIADRIELTRAVALFESSRTDVPVVIGCVRAVILLPAGLLTGFPPEQIESFLIHELAHVRRWDYLVNVLQNLAENLLFYHPAVWWVSGVIRAERENCCDDAVAEFGDPRGFAEALAALEQSRGRQPALAVNGGRLANRVRRLLGLPEGPRSAAGPVVSAGILIASLAVALAGTPKSPAPVLAQVQTGPQSVLDEPWAAPYRNWLNEEAVYIITEPERQAFRSLRTAEELQHFIAQFWARRDPTPGTPQNEVQEEHYRRIAYVNEHFASRVSPGWKTDRGMIYIRFGPPDELEAHSGGTYTAPSQIWHYRFIQRVGTNVNIEFVDSEGTGEYRMTLDPNGAGKQAIPSPRPPEARPRGRGPAPIAQISPGIVNLVTARAAAATVHSGILSLLDGAVVTILAMPGRVRAGEARVAIGGKPPA